MGRFIENLSPVVLLLFLLLAGLTFLAPGYGWQVNTILSGSMEPELPAGGLVVIRPVAANAVEVGDIITFPSPSGGVLITHRVVAVEKGSKLLFHTKGDANEGPDPYTVSAEQVIGKVCFSLPYLGYVSKFVKTPFGLVLSLLIPGLILLGREGKKLRLVLHKEKTEEIQSLQQQSLREKVP
ncbi:MAG: signal peptidase I [Methanosarcinaceae archaeon]|nr:signal peptidase I [Methanosarcinaceae archaeon]